MNAVRAGIVDGLFEGRDIRHRLAAERAAERSQQYDERRPISKAAERRISRQLDRQPICSRDCDAPLFELRPSS
jgi:hypothetical protein